MRSIRIGVLGAARIAPTAVVRPARRVEEATVVAVAARDPAKAARFAAKHGLAVRRSYEDLVTDEEIDAVYVPLPNGLHARWAIAALNAGKHVLCEKPLAANADEAREMAAAASANDRVLMEAFHYRYHPLAERMAEIVHGGELGEIRSVHTWMCFPLPRFGDIRYDYALAGGAMMDAGCYALHCLRLLGPGRPTVTSAHALLHGSWIDRAMGADLRFPDGTIGRLDTSMWSRQLLHIAARVTGDRGELRVANFVAPHTYHRVTVRAGGRTRRFRVPGERTYTLQLRAFTAAVLDGAPIATPPDDSIVNMELIDEVYDAAGLPRRGLDTGSD